MFASVHLAYRFLLKALLLMDQISSENTELMDLKDAVSSVALPSSTSSQVAEEPNNELTAVAADGNSSNHKVWKFTPRQSDSCTTLWKLLKRVTFQDIWRTRDELDVRYATIYREMHVRRSKLFIFALSVAICTSEVSRITKKYLNRPVTTEYTETNMEKAEFPVMLLTFNQRENNDSDLLNLPIPGNLTEMLGTKAFKSFYKGQSAETWANAQWLEYLAKVDKSLGLEKLLSEKLYYTVQEELFYKPNDVDTLRFFSRLLWIASFEIAPKKIECSTHRRSFCASSGLVSRCHPMSQIL